MIELFHRFFFVQMALSVFGGTALGLFHFASLRWTSRFYLAGDIAKGVGLHVVRTLLLIGLLIILARSGAMPLLAGASGVMIGRWFVLRRYRSAP